ELVEQRTLRNLPRSHHQQLSCKSRELNQQPKHRSSRVFQQYLQTADIVEPGCGLCPKQPGVGALHSDS
ncbi:hypothetical protein KBY30_21500, partial [Ruegeria pomeroyi]|nr:hypothetical protein [Ruegeria pomeroyi]